MEDRTAGVGESNQAVAECVAIQEANGEQGHETSGGLPEVSENEAVPTEAAPDLSPKGIRKLRGQYFTVRHVPLEHCGHKQDIISEPRHKNCENCWWVFFRTHPPLCEAVHEAWTTHGKQFVVNLRGEKFVKNFGKYMATVNYLKEQEANEISSENKT